MLEWFTVECVGMWVCVFSRLTAIIVCLLCHSRFESGKAAQEPTKLVMTNSVVICIFQQTPNQFLHNKYIRNQLLFKISSRIISSILANLKQYSNIFSPSAITYCQLRNLQYDLTSRYTGSYLVFSTISLFAEKSTKISFFILTQSRQLYKDIITIIFF